MENFEGRLIEAMAEMANPSKSNTATVATKNGEKYSYNYESLDQVLAVVRPPLMAHGIGLTQRQEWDPETESYVLRTVVFDDDHSMMLDQRPMRQYDDAKACGSWETYMRRYALRCAFGLTGEDDDGTATVGAKRTQPSQQDPEAKHKAWMRRILQLKSECIRLGCTEDDLEGAAETRYGTANVSKLSMDQLADYGKFLNLIKEQGAQE